MRYQEDSLQITILDEFIRRDRFHFSFISFWTTTGKIWPRSFVHLFKALLGRFPIDHIPDGTEVLSFAIFVLKAISWWYQWAGRGTLKVKFILLISMLPSINPQQRFKLPNHRILILTNPGSRLVSCGSALLLLQMRRTHCISLHANGPWLFVLHQPSPSTSLNSS